jgi:ketosteroid isomerase-like protein
MTMSSLNKEVLLKANAAVSRGDNEGFLACCTDDLVWSTVGGETLRGKEAVRAWMVDGYAEPPKFTVRELVAEGDLVVALGDIESKDGQGKPVQNSYSDVWRFRDGKMAELRAFVVPAN